MSEEGDHRCKTCLAGKYPSSDQSQCLLCPKGEVSEQGDHQCEPCSESTYASYDQTSCNPCPQYTTSPVGAIGVDSCVCVVGYAKLDGNTSCTPCAANSYADQEGLTSCKLCGENEEANSVRDGCQSCPADYVRSGPHESGCHCQEGYEANETGSCVMCPVGTYSRLEELVCTQCPEGHNA